jgi:hypothetical protein
MPAFTIPAPKPSDGSRLYLNGDGTMTVEYLAAGARMAQDVVPRGLSISTGFSASTNCNSSSRRYTPHGPGAPWHR